MKVYKVEVDKVVKHCYLCDLMNDEHWFCVVLRGEDIPFESRHPKCPLVAKEKKVANENR
jgi:hypothetical protein